MSFITTILFLVFLVLGIRNLLQWKKNKNTETPKNYKKDALIMFGISFFLLIATGIFGDNDSEMENEEVANETQESQKENESEKVNENHTTKEVAEKAEKEPEESEVEKKELVAEEAEEKKEKEEKLAEEKAKEEQAKKEEEERIAKEREEEKKQEEAEKKRIAEEKEQSPQNDEDKFNKVIKDIVGKESSLEYINSLNDEKEATIQFETLFSNNDKRTLTIMTDQIARLLLGLKNEGVEDFDNIVVMANKDGDTLYSLRVTKEQLYNLPDDEIQVQYNLEDYVESVFMKVQYRQVDL